MKIKKSRYDDDLLLTDEDDNKIYIRRKPEQLYKGDEVVKYKIVEDETLLDIAQNIYKNPKFWWVIADVLNVINPFDVLSIKDNYIILPTLKTVMERMV